eukprot:GHVH01007761.1.p1 GENE.GHVH01007761.1~~GHVH01007761.1.p1  ORF type:complete len:548 (-),score=47.10 GHVH01007761.1:1348-2991(-)
MQRQRNHAYEPVLMSSVGRVDLNSQEPMILSSIPRFESSDYVPDNDEFGTNIVGHGSMAQVSRMKHVASGQVVAIKNIPKAVLSGRSVIAQIEREISIHATLHSHPNVVTLLAQGHDELGYHLVMELARESMCSYLWRKKCISWAECRSVIKQLLTALVHLHSNSIVHRDIKPENLLLFDKAGGGNCVKLGDFGWSNTMLGPRATFCGTMDYLPPEMILQEVHTSSCDIWAVGILAFECLTGQVPWSGGLAKSNGTTFGRGITQHALEARISNLKFPSSLPLEARLFIKACLKFDPSRRPSASKLLTHVFLSAEIRRGATPRAGPSAPLLQRHQAAAAGGTLVTSRQVHTPAVPFPRQPEQQEVDVSSSYSDTYSETEEESLVSSHSSTTDATFSRSLSIKSAPNSPVRHLSLESAPDASDSVTDARDSVTTTSALISISYRSTSKSTLGNYSDQRFMTPQSSALMPPPRSSRSVHRRRRGSRDDRRIVVQSTTGSVVNRRCSDMTNRRSDRPEEESDYYGNHGRVQSRVLTVSRGPLESSESNGID